MRAVRHAVPYRMADPALGAAARMVYSLREQRGALLGEALFSEPAWDMLLDIFIAESDHRRLSVSAVCIGSRASSATALRYLKSLETSALVERIADPLDGRRTYVRLTDAGHEAMRALVLRFTEALRVWSAHFNQPFGRR